MQYFTFQNITLTIVFICSFVLTYLVRKLALKKSIMDIPNERSSHSVPTPRGGGLAIMIAWYAGLITFYLLGKIDLNLFLALMSGVFLSAISIVDDVRNVSPKVRLFFQSLSAGLALWFIGGLGSVDLGFTIFDSIWILSPIAFVAILWAINLFNFLDGIDGHISMAAMSFAVATYMFFQSPVLLLLAVAVFGFFPWNWQRAKIFMGDVGSTLIGFNIAVLAIYFNKVSALNLEIILILTSVYWCDATFTLIRRFIRKEKLSEAHKKHAYQRLTQAGYSHQKVVLSVLAFNLILFAIAWFIPSYGKFYGFTLAFFLNIIFNVFVDSKKAFV